MADLDWTRLTPHLERLFELSDEERVAYLQERCAEDEKLRDDLSRLIALDRDRHSFLRPPTMAPASELPDSADELMGRLSSRSAIGSRYELRSEVARGGMGVILEVWDRDLRRTLAMKVTLDKFGGPRIEGTPIEATTLGRFLEEAQVTGQLDHPGIVPVHELGVDAEGQVFFTMPLVKGRTLGDVIDDVVSGDEEWNRERALGVLVRVCEAMAYAHSKGVLHRDLKPSNIMVGRFGEVYVMDWGVAKVVGSEDSHDLRIDVTEVLRTERSAGDPATPLLTMDGTIVGTPAYMAPEQARGELERVDRRSDVYAIGAMLYQLLTGCMPHVSRGEHTPARTVLVRALEGPPAPVREVASVPVPAELEAICERAMARDPDKRYPDMGALGDDLRAFLEGRVVRTYETGAIAEARKWIQRNTSLAAALGLALLLAVGGTGGIAFVQSKGKRAAEVERGIAQDNENEARRQERIAEERSYLAFLYASLAALEKGELSESRRLHELCPEPHRNWEWAHQELELDHSLERLEHPDGVAFADWSPDGMLIATGSAAGHVHLWDTRTYGLARSLSGGSEEPPASCIAWSPDARQIAIGKDRRSLSIWSTTTGRELELIEDDPDGVYCAAWSPDGRSLVTGTSGSLHVWNAVTGERSMTLEGHRDGVSAVSWSANGKRIASGSWDGDLRIWDLESGESRAILASADDETDQLTAVAMSPDGLRVATGSLSFMDGLLVWDLETGALVRRLEGLAQITTLAWSPDGRHLAAGGRDQTLAVWDPDSGERLATLRGHDGWIQSMSWSPDGRALVSTALGSDSPARVWIPLDGATRQTFDAHWMAVRDVAWSPDGTRIASCSSDRTVRILDGTTGESLLILRGHAGSVSSVAWSSDGTRLASGAADRTVRVWDVGTGQVLHVLEGHDASVASIDWSPSAARIVSAASDGRGMIWDSMSGERLHVLELPGGRATQVAWSPDGTRVAITSFGNRLTVWDASSGACLRTYSGNVSTAVAWSPDGTRLAAGQDSRGTPLLVFDLASESSPRALASDGVSCVAWSPDGSRIVAGDGREMRIWDATSGERLRTFEALEFHPVSAVEWSPDGRRIAIAGARDGAVRVWESRLEDALPGLRARWRGRPYRSLVRSLFEQSLLLAPVVAALGGDPSLGVAERREAIRLALSIGAPPPAYLNELAWPLVSPDFAGEGDVARGLQLSRAAVSGAPEDASFRDTFAWALFANGEHEAALEESQRALDLSAPDEKATYRGSLDRLRSAVDAARGSNPMDQDGR